MRVSSIIAATLLSAAAAAPTVLINWWEAGDCGAAGNAGHRTSVAIENTLCQTVPSDPLQKYKVDCNGGNTGGAISFCDANCQNCNVVNFNNGELLLRQCLPNNAQLFGSASFDVTCSATPVSPAPPTPAAGDFGVAWFETATCDQTSDLSVVVGQAGICQTVPGANGAAATGYVVACSPLGDGGVFSTCTDNTCSKCGTNTTFTNDVCLPNPPQFGSASVAFRCATPAVGGPFNPTGLNSRITWFEQDDCGIAENDHRTIVLSMASLCQRVPDSQTSYRLDCNTQNTGGTLTFCNDVTCANCPISSPFTNDQCHSNPAQTGSKSVSATCNAQAPAQVAPVRGDVVIEWFSSTTCVPPTATSTDTFHTVVVAPAGICHTVPGSSAQNTPTTGYIVTCNDAGTGGVFQTCNSNNCGSCGTNTPFTNGACLPNPANTGSNSVRLQCVNNGTSSVASIAASGAAFLGAAAGIAQLF